MSDADDYEHALGGLRGHIVYGEQTAGDTPVDWVQVKVALPYLRDAERALVAERTRADAAEAELARLTTERDLTAAENAELYRERHELALVRHALEDERVAARAEAAGLRAIVEAADELVSRDYAAEVESYSETAPGSHAAAQVRAADAYSALVKLRDAWREKQPVPTPAHDAAGEGR